MKESINKQVKKILIEIQELEDEKNSPDYNKNRDIIGEHTALSDLGQEEKEKIFKWLSEDTDGDLIIAYKDKIKRLRARLKKQIRNF